MKIGYRRLLPPRLRRWLRSMVVECGLAGCRGFHLSHPLLRRLPGIFLDQTWYCSPSCLRDALKQRVEAQLCAAITDLRHPPRMPFRLILLANGTVSAEQLAHAREMQVADQDLGDALVCLGYATADEVAGARAAEAGCLFFIGVPQPVIPSYTLPLSLMRLYRASPVHYSPVTGRLLVGFVYRINSSLLQAVEQVTGCRVEGCIITDAAWSKQEQAAGLLTPAFEEVKAAGSSQSYIVSLIVEHAIESRADKVRVGLSSTALWARLTGGPRGRDLVIDLGGSDPEDLAEALADPDAAPVRQRREMAKQATARLPLPN